MVWREFCVASTLLSVVVLTVLVTLVAAWGWDHTSLFEDDPNVIDLNNAALRMAHAEANKCPWLVLFYDSMCGHCRAFAPQLTTMVKDFRHRVPLQVGAVNCAAHGDACTAMGIRGVPMLYFAKPSAALRDKHSEPLEFSALKDETLDWQQAPRDSLQKRMADFASSVVLTPREVAACASMREFLRERKVEAIAARPRDKEQKTFTVDNALHKQDVAGAFFLTMWHEVAVAVSSSTSVDVLRTFLRTVHASAPALKADVLLDALEASPSSLENAATWKKIVEKAGIPYAGRPMAIEWKTCRGSSWKYRGFPCGLWSLYHTIVENAPPTTAAKAMIATRSYILTFFMCYECRKHFSELPFDLTEHSSDDDVVMWLWRAHNAVNKRLAKAPAGAADPKVPKVEFPSNAVCSQCWFEGKLDDAQVRLFLQRRYKWASMDGETAAAQATQPVASTSAAASHRTVSTPTPSVPSDAPTSFGWVSWAAAAAVVLAVVGYVRHNRRYRVAKSKGHAL